ncbi:MAG: arsenite methyltransferase [Coriobacteriia bacterium]|nr:arsenite methyltransferase [Coriobacteriia bacterium]
MNDNIRETVQERYGKIAAGLSEGFENKAAQASNCCSGACGCSNQGITDTAVNYATMELDALPREAIEASLGCANPLVFAQLAEGETVLDLGSGGGIDVLMASRFVGDTGKVYGLDMTDEMLKLANENKARMGVANVEFLQGYIEDIPLPDATVDAVISNCVINLSSDKEKALAEAYRVIKPGGRLRIADVVTLKDIDPKLRGNMDMWSDCLAGALPVEEYKAILQTSGFSNIDIEIAHIYGGEMINSEPLGCSETTTSAGAESLDGAFAGALIRADK